MTDRVVIGKHPAYAYTGMFISTPGSDVTTRDPTEKTGLALSSQWPAIANVIASGTCGLDVLVPYPGVAAGMRPYVYFHRLIGTGYNPHEMYGYYLFSAPDLVSEYEKCSRWRLVQGSTGFRIVKNARIYEDGVTSGTFRYIIFNLPVS